MPKIRRRDGNEKVNKKENNRFNEQNNNFARASHFFVHFFAVLHYYDVKMPKALSTDIRIFLKTKIFFPPFSKKYTRPHLAYSNRFRPSIRKR